MTDRQFDAIIIGAGHNGLVTGAYLARSGRRVLVLEATEQPGGAAVTQEFFEGFSVSAVSHLLYNLHPTIIQDLKLREHGLSFCATDLATVALSADGNHIRIEDEVVSGAISPVDAEKYREFHAQMKRFSKLLTRTIERRPPGLTNNDLSDKLAMAQLAWHLRQLGKTEMRELLRVGAINIHDVLEENFDSELLKGAIGIDAVLGSHAGPRSPNTVLTYLYRNMGRAFGYSGPALTEGGMGSVSNALASAATSLGAEIRTGCYVEEILTKSNGVTGVKTSDGELIYSDTVISNADPKKTFAELVGYPNLDTEFARQIHNIRTRGNAAKLHLALDALPQFTGLDADQTGSRLVIAPDLTYIENAFNHAKYGEMSGSPILEISIPSVHDKNLSPDGKHVLSAIIQYAPVDLRDGWSNAADSFRNRSIDLIEGYAPGIKKLILSSQLLTPLDLATQFNLSGGHWHHGELSLDQFFVLRPATGASQYTTPVGGLFICSAGCHPGGDVMGMAGKNCATAVLHERQR